ncbi:MULTISPECIES: (2Fe-2S)-binding protein [Actinomadura]|uniref:(2Fe-2S)-binding protein n=1 Tax=Actinomadura yumaensis TaxID=111807 RepID=A0ABW2CAP5_9ACTN|nr:(2Fe-2S)-binding protein [Actinomadura sp. J1-007]MWK33456.1 ferric iron reductase [Actinomadura sp. J1-007]
MAAAARRAGAAEVREALAAVADLGPYYEIGTDPAEEADPTWRPMPERDADRLLGLTEEYARRLGTGERRVAASILFQGLASRLFCPVVAAAASSGVVPDLSGLHWRWAPGAPIALWLKDPSGRHAGDAAAAAGQVRAAVVEGQLRPLRETMLTFVGLADGLLWGNAAASLAGSLRAGTMRPALAPALGALVDELFTRAPLAGTGAFNGSGFVRRSCCLYYRVPPGGEMCGDCALRR